MLYMDIILGVIVQLLVYLHPYSAVVVSYTGYNVLSANEFMTSQWPIPCVLVPGTDYTTTTFLD